MIRSTPIRTSLFILHVRYLAEATIHVDPLDEAGVQHHQIAAHAHDGLPSHAH